MTDPATAYTRSLAHLRATALRRLAKRSGWEVSEAEINVTAEAGGVAAGVRVLADRHRRASVFERLWRWWPRRNPSV